MDIEVNNLPMEFHSDAKISDKFIDKYPGLYVVISRLNDNLIQSGRARLIWRANTANAIEKLGIPAAIVCHVPELPRGLEFNQEINRIELNEFYGTDLSNTIINVFPDFNNKKDLGLKYYAKMFCGSIANFAGFVHNRDPYLVKYLCDMKIPFVYEDHNEDYHEEARNSIAESLNAAICKGVISITEKVRASLIVAGVNPEKLLTLDSGVSDRAFENRSFEASKCRKFYMKNYYSGMAVYSGGLQDERGITHILIAAEKIPSIVFVLAGGNKSDVLRWKEEVLEKGLGNVRIVGYLNAEDVWILQQAADVLMLTREHGPRSEITSPLKLFEYLASGRPIVSYGHGNELNLDGVALFTYDNARPETLAVAIKRLIAIHSWRPDPIEENQIIARDFTWKSRINKILEFSIS
jgi:glycosyltransferase involved in cell wall biosynthesis